MEPNKRPRGRPRKKPWPEPIPDDPENIMRIIMRTPASEIRERSETSYDKEQPTDKESE